MNGVYVGWGEVMNKGIKARTDRVGLDTPFVDQRHSKVDCVIMANEWPWK